MSRRRDLSERPPWVGTGAELQSGASGSGYPPRHGPMSVNDHLRQNLTDAGEGHETLYLDANAARHVDAYIEYDRIVGNAGRPTDETALTCAGGRGVGRVG